MPVPQALQIVPAPGIATLTPEQKRFNRLIGQIAKARATLGDWQAQIPLFHQAHVKRIEPLLQELRALRREAVFALDALLNQPGWNRGETETLRELICEGAGELIGVREADDTALKALFDKHSEVDYDTTQRESGRSLKDMLESMGGVDLGDDAGIASTEDVIERVRERQAAEAAEAEQHEAARPARKKSAAERRRDDEAASASQSLRQVFRQLASALHPDREPDPAQRDAKTALMQRANQAYAAHDLLALLELQLEVEQVDASHLQGASAQRLKHYNKVLAEQLEGLQREIEEVQIRFELDFGLDLDRAVNPQKLGVLIDQGWRELSGVIAEQRRQQRVLGDRASTKRWLKQMKQRLRFPGGDDFF